MTPYPEWVLAIEAGMCPICIVYISDNNTGKNREESVTADKVKQSTIDLPSKIGKILVKFAELLQATENLEYLVDCTCRHYSNGARQSSDSVITLNQQLLWQQLTMPRN